MDAFSAPSLLSTPIAMSPRHGGGAHPHLKGELAGDGVDATTCFGSYNDEQFEGVDCLELVEQLADTESLHEQADIIHYLFVKKCVHGEFSKIMSVCILFLHVPVHVFQVKMRN